jgi:hypothetical protein
MLEEAFARGWDNLVGRWGGPMSFRFLLQPAVAIFFAIRAGLNDARQHEQPFLGYLLRRKRWPEIWKHVGKVFIVALILDSIYQAIVLRGIYALELLFTATFLVLVPYLVVRGLVTRIARAAGVGKKSVRSAAIDEASEE